jgi:hypothetical protein
MNVCTFSQGVTLRPSWSQFPSSLFVPPRALEHPQNLSTAAPLPVIPLEPVNGSTYVIVDLTGQYGARMGLGRGAVSEGQGRDGIA